MQADRSPAVTYVDALFRNKWLVSGVAGVIMAAALLYALTAKRQYGSTMKIFVQNTRPAPVISSASGVSTSGAGLGSDAMEAQINSEVVLLQAADLMEGLVRYRDLALKHTSPAEVGSVRMAHELTSLQSRMEVVPVRKTNVIEVRFTDPDAYMAQKSLVWLSSAFLEKHAQLRRPAGTFQFFKTQADQYGQQLHDAEEALVDFQRANNLVSLDKEKALTLDNYNRVAQQMGDTRANLQESNQRQSSYQRQMNVIDSRVTTQVRNSPNQYSAERLNSLLVELQNKRTQLSTRFQDADPLVQEVDAQIKSTQASLAEIKAHDSQETTSDINPVHQSLDQALHTSSADVSGGKARLGVLEAEANSYSSRLVDLQKISVQNDTLEREVQDLKQNYETFAQKRDEAAIDDQLDRSKIADVSIAQEPTLSLEPVAPHRMMTLVLGALAACFAAIACVLVKDTMRETAFTAGELETMVSCPVLSTIPEGPSWPVLSPDPKGLPSGLGMLASETVRQA